MATAFDKLTEVVKALNAELLDYVLFGGQAVNLHRILRFTDDIERFRDFGPSRTLVEPSGSHPVTQQSLRE